MYKKTAINASYVIYTIAINKLFLKLTATQLSVSGCHDLRVQQNGSEQGFHHDEFGILKPTHELLSIR